MTVVVPVNVTTAQEYQDALEKSYLMPAAATVSKLVSFKPAATVATHAAALALATSMEVGELVQTVEYSASTGIGSRIMQLVDAGSSGSRPAEVSGYIDHIAGGSGGLYLKTCYMSEQVNPWERGTTGAALALAVARALGQTLRLTHGDYTINVPLVLQSNDKLIINDRARLLAVAGFSGNTMIAIGDTADTEFTENVLIDGGGVIDGDGLVSRGVFVASGRFSKIRNLQINGITGKPLYIGNNSSVKTCYEVDIFNVNMLHKDAQNSSTSIGLLFENTTDCYASEMVIIGYRKGVEVTSTSASIEISKIHPWAREVHGAMDRAFNILGSVTAAQCNADSPFNLVSGVGDLYGWYVSGNLMGSSLRVFMNLTTNHESDDRLWPFYFNGNTESVISTAKVHGGSDVFRFKGFAGGDTVNNVIANKITGPTNKYVIAP